MYELIEFLIEKKYCNNESEAIKILESISDEFYEYLNEEVSGAKRVDAMRRRMGSLVQKVQGNLGGDNTKLVKQIKTIRSAIPQEELKARGERAVASIQGKTAKGLRATPLGPQGQRAQTDDIASTRTAAARTDRPMTGATINRDAGKLGRAASILTKSPEELQVGGNVSTQRTGVTRTGRYSNMQTGGGATAALPNQGQSRTGSRFPRQRG
jgi:hypothetical protein